MQIGWHTDAFEQLGKGSFAAIKGGAGGKDRIRDGVDKPMDGPESWMDDWTMFYWGWWIAWSPFVGEFFKPVF
jgi:hypothetical protein